MPSKSKKQHRFMEAAAHDPGFAENAGIPQDTAQEFVSADDRAIAGHSESTGKGAKTTPGFSRGAGGASGFRRRGKGGSS